MRQKAPFASTADAMRLADRRQTRSCGGSAETEEKALTVAPCRPAVPLVVTTATLLATCRIPDMNSSRELQDLVRIKTLIAVFQLVALSMWDVVLLLMIRVFNRSDGCKELNLFLHEP